MHELTAALLIAVRVGLPGWLWSKPENATQEAGRPAAGAFSRAGRAIALGLVLNLLPALCIAQCGGWTPRADWALWAGVVLAGLLWRRGSARAPALADAACVLSFLALVTAVTMWQPPRSEWFAGGWDPGLYQNAGVVVARADGFQARTNSVYAAMTGAERSLFGDEAFPAVTLDARTGALRHYFFQLTPMCGALWYRLGGLAALARMNQMLALMGLPLVFALAGALGVTGWRRAWMLAAWMLSPLWWYQQAIPTTEVLQLLLLGGAAVFYVDAERRGDPFPLASALCLAAIGINHFGFPPLVAMLLVVSVSAESVGRRPGRVGRFLTCAAALAIGLGWDLTFSQGAIVHLQIKDHVIPMVLGPFSVCLVAAAVICRREIHPRLVAWACALTRWGALGAGILVAVFAAALACPYAKAAVIRYAGHVPVAGDGLLRFSRILPFHGATWFILFGAGVCLLARDCSPATRRLRVLAAALGGVLLLLILNPGIAPIYPWALRRYVVFLVPLMAIVLGYGVTLPAQWRRFEPAGRAVALLAVAALLFVGTRASRKAATVGDYVGLSAALAVLNGSVQSGDIVVADDARAGTPLLLMYGRDVLDGRRLWDSRSPEYQRKYVAMLRRLQATPGRRIVWLTSTKDAMGTYPSAVGPVTPLTEPFDVTVRTVIHSPKADQFAMRDGKSRFQLHAWLAPER